MLKFLILVSVFACALSASIPDGLVPQLDGRIVGGTPTTIREVPWQISLKRNNTINCGGSIYSDKIIVTSAHCVQTISENSLRIRAGSSHRDSGGVVISVAAFKTHEDYNPFTRANDIAVIRLSTPLTYSESIQNISLASSAPENNAAAVVSGWGTTIYGIHGYPFFPSILQSANVAIVSRSECENFYGKAIGGTVICAGAFGIGTCQGDSGGPLVSGGVLVGVVSWGYGCALPNYPDVYADVSAFRSWLDSAASEV